MTTNATPFRSRTRFRRIYERRLTGRVYPGDVSRGQAFVHLDDTLNAIRLAVEKRQQLAPDTTLLIGEPETLSYDELQRAFAWLIHGEEWETHQIPKSIAKTGAWMLDNVPLIEEPFIKPWMVDLADDDYSLDIGRARADARMGAEAFARRHPAEHDRCAETRSRGVVSQSRTPLACLGQGLMAKDPRDIPPGWDFNPATWTQRLPVIGLAIVGFVIASYLALYQWRIVSWVWDPFFPDGSLRILNSKISNILPIPDAALGAISYLVDAVTGAIGGRARWRTMPWIVIVFGLAVGPLGVVSVMLVVFQPVLFDAWCTLCLASAVVSLMMIGPAMDEFLASLQHLKRASDEGVSLWRVFWGLRTSAERTASRL